MFLLLILLLRFASCVQISAIVNTEYGPVEGNITSMGRTFTAIPFAAPPINNLRWMAPIPPKSWTNVLETKQLPPQCPQICDDTNTYWCAPTTSEDCLYVNVWTPLNSAQNLPVLVWIYGGGFVVGYGAGLQKNGTILANSTNTIVVSMNYRVGAMGFYYNENLDILGQFGYLDQVYAIEWVYNNIARFGGDPNKITIAGESAGAHSVIMHVLNKTSLISGAIAESFFGGSPLLTTDNWNNGVSDAFIAQCGCNVHESKEKQLQCLKDLRWEDVVQNQDPFRWTPTANTTMFPTDPIFGFQTGDFNQKVQFIIGMNLGEYYYMMGGNDYITYSELESNLQESIGTKNAEMALEFYNCTDKPKHYNFVNETAQIYTDCLVKCPSRNVTATQAIYGNKNGVYSYYYHFAHVSSFIDKEPGCNPLCEYLPCHTTEIPYVFNDDLSPIGIQFTAQERLLAQQFQYYWSNMANSLNPNQGYPVNVNWTSYDNDQRAILYFDIGAKMKMQYATDQTVCDFWDSLGYSWLFSG